MVRGEGEGLVGRTNTITNTPRSTTPYKHTPLCSSLNYTFPCVYTPMRVGHWLWGFPALPLSSVEQNPITDAGNQKAAISVESVHNPTE
jgi:hypothetical protein